MHDKHGLLSSPISAVLLKMTVPMTLGMLSVLMFNLVDTYFISLLGTQSLAAISYTFPVAFSVNCITMGIGIGLSTSVGRLLGQRKLSDAASLTTHGLLLALVLVILASCAGLLTIDSLFTLLGARQDLLPLIRQYMEIWYLSVPFLVIPMAGSSAIRATGDTSSPAKMMVASGLLNGLLDPLLIFGYGPFPELGIQGAAIASAISWVSALLGTGYIMHFREHLLTRVRATQILSDWKKILRIGTPAALSNAMTPLSGAILMRLISQHGTAAVAAYGAAQRIESILILVLMSLTSVLTPFMSQNFGADNPDRSFSGLFLSIRFSIIFQLLIFIMMVPLSIPLSGLFSQEVQVKELLWHYLLFVPFSYGFQGVLMMVVSALNALHRPVHAFIWSFMRLFIITLPCAWLGSQLYHIEGLFMGIAAGNIIGGTLGYFQALQLRKQHQPELTDA